MSTSANTSGGLKGYLKEQNIVFTFERIGIQAMSGMAQGLFASLLIGTIIGTIGKYTPGALGEFFASISGYTGQMQGAAMAMAIGYAVQSPPYVLFSLATVGFTTNSLGGAGGALAVYFVSLIAIFFGKLVSKRTPVDLLVTPTVTILTGVFVANIIAPPIGAAASSVGYMIMWATEQQPFIMGILVATIVGITLTLPISSAAICAALSLVGLAGGAAVAGCCAQMVGLAVASFRENKINGLSAIGLGAGMLMVPNILRKPVLWLPAILTGMITGPIATCVFQLKMNGTPISSGMGTCGLVGPIGVITGWFSPDAAAVALGETAVMPGAKEWLGLLLICFVLPAILSFIISEFMRKKGWIEFGDYKLV